MVYLRPATTGKVYDRRQVTPRPPFDPLPENPETQRVEQVEHVPFAQASPVPQGTPGRARRAGHGPRSARPAGAHRARAGGARGAEGVHRALPVARAHAEGPGVDAGRAAHLPRAHRRGRTRHGGQAAAGEADPTRSAAVVGAVALDAPPREQVAHQPQGAALPIGSAARRRGVRRIGRGQDIRRARHLGDIGWRRVQDVGCCRIEDIGRHRIEDIAPVRSGLDPLEGAIGEQAIGATARTTDEVNLMICTSFSPSAAKHPSGMGPRSLAVSEAR